MSKMIAFVFLIFDSGVKTQYRRKRMSYSALAGLLLIFWSVTCLSCVVSAAEATADERWTDLSNKALTLLREEKLDQIIELLRPPLDRAIPNQVDSPVAITTLCILGAVYQEVNKIAEADNCFTLAVRAVDHVQPQIDHELSANLSLKSWAGNINVMAARYYVNRGNNFEALKRFNAFRKVASVAPLFAQACEMKLYESYVKFSLGYVKSSADLAEECLDECQGKINDPECGSAVRNVYLGALTHQRLLSLAWAPSAKNYRDHPVALTLDVKNAEQTVLDFTIGPIRYPISGWEDAIGVANFIDRDPIRNSLMRCLDQREAKRGLANAVVTKQYLDFAIASLAVTKKDEGYRTATISGMLNHGQRILYDNGITASYNAMAFLWIKYRLYDMVQLPHKVICRQAIAHIVTESKDLREQAGLTGEPDILDVMGTP